MNIVVVGNCQSRPLATMLGEMCQSVSCIDPIVAHLARPENEQAHIERLSQADLILSQPIDSNFPASHITTAHIREMFGDRLVVWPNLFFSGQCPDLFTATVVETGEKLKGPLETYHSAGIFNAWKVGKSARDATRQLENESVHEHAAVVAVAEDSMRVLQQREIETDIGMSDFVKTHFHTKQLFHVFNHPNSFMMIELSRRICKYAGLQVDNSDPASARTEPLGRLSTPTTGPLAQQMGLDYETSDEIRGLVVECKNNQITLGAAQTYTFSELVDASFNAYDRQPLAASSIQCTPSYVAPLVHTGYSEPDVIRKSA